ncbi:MAG: crossover junction endodeoxyribonuclease RuvC [Pseudomonadota bacterium]|nr:crossover junction endodeoxyribonuclease RuvC [Pseudomonadota bacterium]
MKVLGIDPGSRSTGWGVVTREHGRYRLLAAGAIRTSSDTPMPERLLAIHQGLVAVLVTHAPDVIAIEAIFSHKSATSALVLGQARGVALVAAAASGRPVFEYNAMTIKSSVAGSGRADKEAVGRMVAVLLGGAVEGPHDAVDAVAVAMTHHAHAHRHAAAERLAVVTAKIDLARAAARRPARSAAPAATRSAPARIAPSPPPSDEADE